MPLECNTHTSVDLADRTTGEINSRIQGGSCQASTENEAESFLGKIKKLSGLNDKPLEKSSCCSKLKYKIVAAIRNSLTAKKCLITCMMSGHYVISIKISHGGSL